jgi:hypothetical protein
MTVDEMAAKSSDFVQQIIDEGMQKARVTLGTVYRKTIDYLRTRKRAYQLVFASNAGQIVLEDLAQFCRAEQTCWDADPRLNAVLEGRREVWLRIVSHLNRNPLELNQMFGGPKVTGEYA